MVNRFAAQGANGEAGAEGSPLQRAAPVTWAATLRGLRCAEGDCSISTAGGLPEAHLSEGWRLWPSAQT